MTPEARAMLDQIDEFLTRRYQASSELAAVLTALRSDDCGKANKMTTTIPIRRAALPKSAAMFDAGDDFNVGTERNMSFGSKFGLTFMEAEVRIGGAYDYADHFAVHARMAAEALGLPVVEDLGTNDTDEG